jgi:ATP-dependent RNA helicase DeaD
MTSAFTDLGIRPELLLSLAKQEISLPTPIQKAAIPVLLENKDAYLQAETGTGKTLAYLLPLFSKIDPRQDNAQVIILAPTHELAIQIQRQCSDLSQQSGLAIRNILLIGGTSLDRQLEKLKKKPHVIIGSIGRIRDLIEARKLKVQMLRTLVIDEADRLLVPEAMPSLQFILKACTKNKNIIFVSASGQPANKQALVSLATDLVVVKTSAAPVNSDIVHLALFCEERDKAEMLRKLIHALEPKRSIVFVHKNEQAEIIASKLAHHKLKVIDIHGTLDKEDRKKAMDSVRSGKVDVLIASDVAARGLDIKGLTHVFNFDVPTGSDAYLHRVGRCGRAGVEGVAISLMDKKQEYLIERFKKDLGINMIEIYLKNGEVHEKVSYCNTDT